MEEIIDLTLDQKINTTDVYRWNFQYILIINEPWDCGGHIHTSRVVTNFTDGNILRKKAKRPFVEIQLVLA